MEDIWTTFAKLDLNHFMKTKCRPYIFSWSDEARSVGLVPEVAKICMRCWL